MRRTICLASLALVAACGQKAPDTDEAVDGFRPPVTMSRSDFGATLDPRFDALDHNHDGALAGDELLGRRGARAKAMDRDGNGKVTRGEFVAGSLATFDAQDLNHDGNVTSDERRLARQRGAAAAPADAPAPGNGQ